MLKAGRFARFLRDERFKQADKRKFGNKLFKDDVESAWVAGALTVVEDLNIMGLRGDIKDLDELRGELHTMAVELFNNFNTRLGKGQCKPASIEDFLKLEDVGAEIRNEKEETVFNAGKWLAKTYGV